jgi:hypothetical protein
MTANSTAQGAAARRLALAPTMLALLLTAVLVAGVFIGALISYRLGTTPSAISNQGAAAPAATFDAAGFRATEKNIAAPTFDAVSFRREEKDLNP